MILENKLRTNEATSALDIMNEAIIQKTPRRIPL